MCDDYENENGQMRAGLDAIAMEIIVPVCISLVKVSSHSNFSTTTYTRFPTKSTSISTESQEQSGKYQKKPDCPIK